MLRDGRLRPRQGLSGSTAPIDVAALATAEQWPDIVEAEFVDADGRRYQLFVDCYHGSGGTWRMSQDPQPT